jgi:hypothetical protein
MYVKWSGVPKMPDPDVVSEEEGLLTKVLQVAVDVDVVAKIGEGFDVCCKYCSNRDAEMKTPKEKK